MVVFIASIGYLWQQKMWWDDLASAAARITVLFCSIVLLTGMVWGKSAWGQWWSWSPRLTFSLVLWLLYVVYLIIRPSIESPHRRALISAVYGLIAFIDVPLVHMSTRLMPDIHPISIEMAPAMKLTLLCWFVPVTMLAFGLIVERCRLNTRLRIRHDPTGVDDPGNSKLVNQTGGSL
jgi:heme exporter protein C